MKAELEKVSNLERRLNIQVPTEKVSETVDRVYKSIQNHVEIKGFRKGKAPLQTIKTMYADRVKDDVVKELVQTHYVEALQEHNLEPLGQPQIEYDSLNENEPFKFSVQFEIRPEIKLSKVEGLNIDKEKLEIDEKKIEETLEKMRTSRASEKPLLIIRPAKKGDLATIDFQGVVDGQPLPNSDGKDHTMELGSSGFIPGFDEGIEGMNVGESRKIDLKFPDNYREGLAGKPVTFSITLQRLGQKETPELNDEFAKTFGEFNTLNDLKEAIKKDMIMSEEARVTKDLKSRVVKALVESNPVDVPPGLLREQKKALIEDLHQKMHQQGLGHEQFEEYKKKWDKDFEKSAEFIIKSSFLITHIADEQGLRASEQDVEDRLETYAQQTGIELKRVKEYYQTPERTSSLRFQITEEKVVDLLISKAQVKEVPKSQLTDLEEAE
ncbi:MAG: trigger factor [Bdellovibrionales bacterium]